MHLARVRGQVAELKRLEEKLSALAGALEGALAGFVRLASGRERVG